MKPTALGYSQQALANEFDMGINGGRTIRRWESGQCPANSIAAYTLTLMMKGLASEAASGALDIGECKWT